MTNEQRDALVAHWLEVEVDEAEDARTLAGSLSDDYREGVWHVLSDQLDDAHEALVTNNWRKVEREADALLQAAGLPALDHEGAQVMTDRWRTHYNTVHPHSSLRGQPPAPETLQLVS
jgi:transposase InsO family protein